MEFGARLFFILFLAVFAVSNSTHAVSANNMALEMAVTNGIAMAAEDCTGCLANGESSKDTTLCKLDCTAPGTASLTATPSFDYMLPVLRHHRPLGMTIPHGLRAPPDPFPPRPFI